MPTRNPVMLVPGQLLPGGELNPFNWVDISGSESLGIQQSAVMRGQPPFASAYQMRQQRGPQTVPQPVPFYLTSRPYSRGAGAHAPKFGTLPINPIGAGVYAPYKLPVIAGPGARYQAAAIWFDVQTIPTSMNINPTMPVETLDALIATSYVGGSYLTTG